MSKTLYVQIKFVNLLQKNPGYNIYNDAGNPYLDVSGFQLPVHKYSLEAGFGDPGEPSYMDNWDFAEFNVSSATFIRPANLNSYQTYQTEGLNGTSHQSTYKEWWQVSVPDDFAIPGAYDNGALPSGWTGSSHSGAESSDFTWNSNGTYTFSGSTHNLSDFVPTSASQIVQAAEQVGEWAAERAGVSSVWEAASRSAQVGQALTTFATGGTNLLSQLMQGSGTMDPAYAAFLIDDFMQGTSDQFHRTATSLLGGGVLNDSMDALRLAERWAYNPATGSAATSEFVVEDGATDYSYFGQYAFWSGTIPQQNDVVLDGDQGSLIDTGYDSGATPAGQVDYVGGGGGNDLILTYEGNDAIAAGSGNDRINAGSGADFIDGGSGIDTAVYTGPRSYYGLTTTSGGSWIITDLRNGSPDGTDTLKNIERLSFSDTNMVLTPTGQQDVSGEGKSDIIWHSTSGDVATWSGLDTNTAGQSFGQVGTNWQIAGTGDFDDDGRADLLWRSSGGDVVIWTGLSNGMHGGISLGNVGTNWKIAGAADFDGDGRSDILWRSTAGDVAVWDQITTQGHGGASYGNVGLDWHIASTGDFDADGKSDILWRSMGGDVVTWEDLDVGTHTGRSLGAVGLGWHIAAAGDFSGDNQTDILWRSNNGDVVTWENISNTQHSGQSFGNVGLGWSVINTGDYNGDGKDGILWRGTDGTVVTWEDLSGGQHGGQSYGIVGLGWDMVKNPMDVV